MKFTRWEVDISALRCDLLQAWPRFRRRFPWRETRDPYALLVAEVLLHRTRAEQAAPIFARLLGAYPDVCSLSAATRDELRTILQSVGLRWRVDLLSYAAQIICRDYGGEIPRQRDLLEGIPGIGQYIASAIRCFAYGEADALIDTNTVRVLTRVYRIKWSDSLRRNAAFRELSNRTLDPEHPQEFNLALLDLAAAICTPRNPRCAECPLLKHCAYGLASTNSENSI